ncbi:MAG: hypothetical protein WC979_01730 [Candidatus Pacearchaeota archaeon]|jgi:predicted DNA-binding protein|nr:hypothetical protein [Clostridia bacterium]
MKKLTAFSIEESIADEFDKLAKENSLNKSSYIQKYMEAYIKKCKENV